MVNYFFTLAHFCESHGPVSLLNTRQHTATIVANLSSNSNACASCELRLPKNSEDEDEDDTHYLYTQCDESVSFISSRYFNNRIINDKLKAIVVRSLSEEANSKICFFGDTNLMYSISRCFTLKDALARGKSRKYSLILTSDNQNSLLKNSNKISSFFHYLIKYLKKRQLINLHLLNNRNFPLLSLNNPPTAPKHRKQVSLSSSLIEDLSSSDLDAHNPNINANGHIDYSELIRNQKVVLRNLSDILDDKQIYVKIHLVALRFLKELYDI